MMAIADAAENPKKFRPPPEVAIANFTAMYGDPYGGGWMDWPAGQPAKVNIAGNITEAFKSLGRYSGSFGEWEESHPSDAKIWHEITSLRMLKKAADNG